jgi:N-acetylmuramoyl-L-alanine amidase
MKTHKVLLFVFFILLLTLSSFIKADNDKTNPFIVVLDAGHGGKDPGKPSKYGFKEKDIALKLALKIGGILEGYDGIKVIYTRRTDVFIELKDRPKIANKAEADLFVSIHCNAHHTQAYGTETYVLDIGNTNRNFEVAKAENEVIFLEDDYEKNYGGFNPNSPESMLGVSLAQEEYTDQSILLASLIEKNFKNKIKRKSRGVKQASLWVIHQTFMPSVLIEAGFVTNKSEGAYLNSKKGQQEISQAIVDAIIEYKHNIDGNVSASIFKGPLEEHSSQDNYEVAKSADSNIIFKVQIAAGSKKIETKPYNFKKLKNISVERNNNLYKYYFGNTSNYNEIMDLEKEAKSKGYKTSFIVAFKEGKRIPLNEALKTTAN